ncbi:MAG: AbrB/MazE/SpoVT family DNA-binding domain-containing protein [Candidatus Nealsonbacteria bacterium DGGOD1a]|jgi:antitoxin component of MazEF toxin-antitoxin module|nr:MAG: AbrB/MazE/SpoVT family DNA-binding domain-containing protein [Candidatus Nealsonbacteria bacterium DGGOD1a]
MNRKTSEKNIRNLTRLGKTSLSITIPRNLILELGWRKGQKVVVKKRGKGLTIEDWQEKLP